MNNQNAHLQARHRNARTWQWLFTAATWFAIIALVVLLLSVIDQAFGLVAVENKVNPAELSSEPLDSLDQNALIAILQDRLNTNRIRTLERDNGPLAEMSQSALLVLVQETIVQPKVEASYPLFRSLFDRAAVEAEIAQEYPEATIEFRAWLTPQFLIQAMSSDPNITGVRTALLGSLYVVLITILTAFPIGVGAAIYLEEYADQRSRINRVIQTNIDNLAGVPSIVYGILGLAIFVRALSSLTSGAIFGMTSGSGRTILSAGLTMGLLVLPILIINAQEAIRAVPSSLRQASYGLGGTKWQTIWYHVLPQAMPGILTGAILAISRAIGETAPLIVIGASTTIFTDPSGPFSKFTALPIQIYNWTTRPQAEFRNIAAAAILTLLIALLSLNAFAILLRNRFRRQSS